ncbi:hemerythrin domain-containing protein [Ectothiorhodospiraceae bacterium WFHF3C12]|nr:hemerythrin domain-containing protein [Ectothiorhodospiraceae bacterium WFHF3C12]
MDNQVLKRLRQDHDNLRALLQAMQQQLECVEANNNPDFALMEDILGYLVRNPDHYHYPFEELLMQRLVACRPDAVNVVSHIHGQRKRLARKSTELQRRIDEIEVGIPVPRDHLLRTARAYVRLYRSHLNGEERDLFPVLDESLTAQDWMEMTTAFQWTLDPAFTPENAAHYRDLRDRIEHEFQFHLPQSGTGFCPLCVQ